MRPRNKTSEIRVYWSVKCDSHLLTFEIVFLSNVRFMLGSGFLTEAIGETLVTAVGPVRLAGRGDAEPVRPGDS